MSPWFIIAQILGVIVIGFEFASYQIKDKRKYLLVNGIGSGIWALMFLFTGLATTLSTQILLALIGLYSSVRALVFWWIFAKDTKKRRMAGRIFLYTMIFLALSIGTFTITQLPTSGTILLQSLVLFFALCFVIGQYMPGKHAVRITVFFYAAILLLTQTPLNILYAEPPLYFRWNPMGMLIEGAKMVSVIVFYGLLIHKKLLARKLVRIKTAVNCELNKINSNSEISILAESGVMKISELERLVAKMVRMEVKLIDVDEIHDVGTSERCTQAIMDDLKTVHDLKMIMEKIIIMKRKKLESKPIPKLSNVQDEMKEVILGKA